MRITSLVLGAIASCVSLFILNSTALETSTVDKINTSIQAASSLIDIATEVQNAAKTTTSVAKKVGSQLVKVLKKLPFEKIASCLGVFGAFVSILLVFLPKQDSAELKYMKKKFAAVEMKLDRITDKLENFKDLLELKTQMSQYMKAEHDILHARTRLDDYMNEIMKTACSTKTECQRKRLKIANRYVNDFNIQKSLNMIFEGTYQKNTFSEPLFGLLNKHSKGNIVALNNLANGVLSLGFKAQQVLLTYEKLKGSKISIMKTMSDWLEKLYKVRAEKYKYEKFIYESASQYIRDDVKNSKYQGSMSNSHSAKTMRYDLRNKYAWLDWIVIAYTPEKDQHNFDVGRGAFKNMPKDKNKRKRVLIAAAQANGSYRQQRNKFASFIASKRNDVHYSLYVDNVKELYKMFKKALKNKGLWHTLRTFIILDDQQKRELKIEANTDEHSYYSESFTFYSCHSQGRCIKSGKVHIIAVFKPTEEIKYLGCIKTCSHGNGICVTKPYSGQMSCQCRPYYEGTDCESRIKTDIAKNLEDLFASALQIPDLVDVYFGIKDLGDKLGSSLGNIKEAIDNIEKTIEASFDKVSRHIDQNFKWANLITAYNEPIEKMKHSAKRFSELQAGSREIKELAKDTLDSHHISFWLSQLNKLIVGRNDVHIKHKPFIHMIMDKNRHLACSDQYYRIIRTVWQQINTIQIQGYMAWIQALVVEGRPTERVLKEYQRVVALQKQLITSKTCNINIENSVNGKCTGTISFYAGMTIDLKCKPNYYISGGKTPSCRKLSKCIYCGCNVEGSKSQQCDSDGKCTCKGKFRGDKCDIRDCKWHKWGAWSSCSKACDYSAQQYRTRSTKIAKRGRGKTCAGLSRETKICFQGTCKHKCRLRHTSSHSMSSTVSLLHFNVHCGPNELMKGFTVQKKGNSKYKYEMECCKINTNDICVNKERYNGWTASRYFSVYALDAQRVRCWDRSFIRGYKLVFSKDSKQLTYKLSCCNMKKYWRRKMKCRGIYTAYLEQKKHKFLPLVPVSCGDRYFLSYFLLQRNGHYGKKFRYYYKCCGPFI